MCVIQQNKRGYNEAGYLREVRVCTRKLAQCVGSPSLMAVSWTTAMALCLLVSLSDIGLIR